MKTRISNLILLSSIALAYSAQAQTTTSFAYTNVSLHIGNGSTIEKGAIGVKDGKIVEVVPVSGLKARHGDVGLGVKLLCDSACDAVQLHAVELTSRHVVGK